MMKRNPLGTLLLVLFFICVCATAFLAYYLIQSTRKLQSLQPQVAEINGRGGVGLVQALAADSLNYSKRNPSIDPLLQSLRMKPMDKPGSAPTRSLPAPPKP
jgi:hypothetical protein